MITPKIIANGIVRAIVYLVLAALVLYFIYLIQSVLIYLVSALILTLIGNPIMQFLKKRLKFKHTLATVTTLFLFVLCIAGLILMFVPLIASQGQNLSLLKTAEIEEDITQLTNQTVAFLESHNIDTSEIIKEANIGSTINLNFIPDFLNSVLGTISSFGLGLASVLFITFFFIKDTLHFRYPESVYHCLFMCRSQYSTLHRSLNCFNFSCRFDNA
jgi:predicted PurR-regulated permease PerM